MNATRFPARVDIFEEGVREGFQSLPMVVPTEVKLDIIRRLSATGLKQIAAASFVRPDRVPGWADAEEVASRLEPVDGVSYSALWFNRRGLERAARHAGRLELLGSLTLSASRAFIQRNQNIGYEQALRQLDDVVAWCRELSIPVPRAAVSAAFGCNYEGPGSLSRLLEVVADLRGCARKHGLEIEYLTLADTMGWADPVQVGAYVDAVRAAWPGVRICLHLHDTRGLGLANAYAGLAAGVDLFDASLGGLGGCPFGGSVRASGNVSTEDLVYLCHRLGIATGVDLARLVAVSRHAEEVLGIPLPGRLKNVADACIGLPPAPSIAEVSAS
ncbi:hydroxymethylglutaryl-CoA lyase [Pigmentiphaga soli]|uniref:Hydroxymethylglutaryl-CoA lyase n=1 Tax=Pigmentiphaga soli TaxID=1007095 RepID=A0ABP8H4I8_9BURK